MTSVCIRRRIVEHRLSRIRVKKIVAEKGKGWSDTAIGQKTSKIHINSLKVRQGKE